MKKRIFLSFFLIPFLICVLFTPAIARAGSKSANFSATASGTSPTTVTLASNERAIGILNYVSLLFPGVDTDPKFYIEDVFTGVRVYSKDISGNTDTSTATGFTVGSNLFYGLYNIYTALDRSTTATETSVKARLCFQTYEGCKYKIFTTDIDESGSYKYTIAENVVIPGQLYHVYLRCPRPEGNVVLTFQDTHTGEEFISETISWGSTSPVLKLINGNEYFTSGVYNIYLQMEKHALATEEEARLKILYFSGGT